MRNGIVNFSGLGYYRKFGQILELSTGYYLYDFHYSMLGLGLSFRLNKLGIYLAMDNVIGIFNLYRTHTADLSFGINISIF